MPKKRNRAGKPYQGHASNQSDLTLQLCVKKNCVGAKEAKAELIRRNKPLLPPEVPTFVIKEPPVDKLDKRMTVIEEKSEPLSPVEMLIEKIKRGHEDEDQEVSHNIKSVALGNIAALVRMLNSLLADKNLAKAKTLISAMKRLKAAANRLKSYIDDKCGDVPTESQKKSIRGRLERLEETCFEAYSSLGSTDELEYNRLISYFKPCWEFIQQ